MQIVEIKVKSKKDILCECEDTIIVTKDFIAVIDGVTSKNALRIDNMTLGRISALTLCEAIKSLPEELTSETAISLLTKALSDKQNLLGITDKLSSTLAIYSNYQKEVWMVGDTKAIINKVHYEDRAKVDIITSEARCMYLQCLLAKGSTIKELQEKDLGRELILPLLKEENMFENSDNEYGYSVLNGIDLPKVRIIKVLDKCDDLILATDGYPVIKETLIESEAILQEILESDPLLINEYKATKGLQKNYISFDDRAYIRFRI